MNPKIIHPIAGTLAMLIIATFWTTTTISELFLSVSAIVAVKHYIAYYGIACLAVCMAMTGGTGNFLGKARKGRLITDKQKRMKIIALNGIFIMLPSAIFLNYKASSGQFDTIFYVVQVIELMVGIVQLTLLGKNFQAGLKMSGRLRKKKPAIA